MEQLLGDKYKEYHGCGHMWINMTTRWDEGDEVAGFWWYLWDWDIEYELWN
jgi:hypothetical protein